MLCHKVLLILLSIGSLTFLYTENKILHGLCRWKNVENQSVFGKRYGEVCGLGHTVMKQLKFLHTYQLNAKISQEGGNSFYVLMLYRRENIH